MDDESSTFTMPCFDTKTFDEYMAEDDLVNAFVMAYSYKTGDFKPGFIQMAYRLAEKVDKLNTDSVGEKSKLPVFQIEGCKSLMNLCVQYSGFGKK